MRNPSDIPSLWTGGGFGGWRRAKQPLGCGYQLWGSTAYVYSRASFFFFFKEKPTVKHSVPFKPTSSLPLSPQMPADIHPGRAKEQ